MLSLLRSAAATSPRPCAEHSNGLKSKQTGVAARLRRKGQTRAAICRLSYPDFAFARGTALLL